MKDKLKILYLYEQESDVILINEALKRGNISFEEKLANSRESFLTALQKFSANIIIAEMSTSFLPSSEALEILKSNRIKIPFILVSDFTPIDQILEVIKAGASDYISKDRMERLPVALNSALEKHQLEKERNEYINKLEIAETRFRALIENTVDAVLILNTEGNPTYASPSIKRVLGYTEEETLQLSLYTVVHPEDRPLVTERMAECLQKPGISLPVIQCRVRHKNGNWVWYEGTITNMLHDPAINGIVDNFHDISEIKLAEEELKESEEKYRSFFENSLDAILLTVPDGQVLAANAAACKMFQMTEEEICKAGRNGLVNLDASLEKSLAERENNGKVKGHLTFLRKDGSKFRGEISSAIFNDFKGNSRTSMIIRDISERVKSEEELKVSKENYQFLFEYSASPKWIFDMETDEILDANERALETYGYSREEFLNMKTIQLKPPEELPRMAKIHKELKDMEGLIQFGIFTQLKKDKTKVKAEVSGHKCYFKNRPCMVIESFDVTDREKTLQQLKDIQEKLITAQKIAKLGYWKYDLQHTQLYWSDEIYKIFGVDEKNFNPNLENLIQCIHPEDRENFYNTRENTFNEVKDYESDYRIITPNGNVKWVHENGKFIRNERGEPLVFEGTAQDITSQKFLELSLEESNQRYQMVSEATSDAIWDWDFTTDKAYWGKGFQTIFGYDLQQIELMDDFWESNIHPEDRERVISSIEQARKSDQLNWSMEYRFRKGNGRYAFVVDKGFFTRNKNGEPIRLAGGMQDITERKELEDLLEKATKLARIGSYEYNLENNNSMYWSEITKEIHEVGKNYVLTQDKIKDFFKPGDDLESITIAFEKAVEKGIPFDVEIPIITGKGNNRWIRVMGETEFVNGKCARVYGSVQDIDQRKKAEEALRASNERFRMVSKATNDSIWDWDLINNKILRPGKRLENMLGYKDVSPFDVDNFWQSHVFPDDWKKISEGLKLLFENPNENYWEDEYGFLKPDGSYASIYDRGYVIRDKNGKAIRMIGASRDISKLKESEIQLKLLNEQLEERAKELVASNQELEQFAYVASHDLQEPLRMVTSFLTQVEKKYNDLLDEKGKTYIYFAVDGAKRMRQMILDLLEFSRAGRIVGEAEQIDLNDLLKDILDLHQKQIEETKAIVKINKLPTVAVAKTSIRQVFQNLISNSLKYNKLKEGVIPQVSVSVKDINDYWQFEVKDNGIGIDSQYFDKIFIIFQRLHDRSEYSGTGIGLSITKKIIENLEGTIWIESEIGKGTSFFFTIPKKLNQN